ncbi:unnamed protein product, partial [Discosporangium mesarthrocarpum]
WCGEIFFRPGLSVLSHTSPPSSTTGRLRVSGGPSVREGRYLLMHWRGGFIYVARPRATACAGLSLANSEMSAMGSLTRRRRTCPGWRLVPALILATLVCQLESAGALRCYTCSDCGGEGDITSAQVTECEPWEKFCAVVTREIPENMLGLTSTPQSKMVDRVCSSVEACRFDGKTLGCCSTDMCNWGEGSEGKRVWGYEKSEEHLRNLMQGVPRGNEAGTGEAGNS